MTDDRLYAPAALRNRGPILDVLRAVLPDTGVVLEIASGSGEHVVYFAAHWPALIFQPTDPDPGAVRSIAAWVDAAGVANVRPPLLLDAAAPQWPVSVADAIVCINMIHISPWAAAEGLLRRAGAMLSAGAPLYLYGPFRRHVAPWAESNEAFDHDLRVRNPAWGVRQLETVADLAAAHGFGPPHIVEMPANNLSVIFRRV